QLRAFPILCGDQLPDDEGNEKRQQQYQPGRRQPSSQQGEALRLRLDCPVPSRAVHFPSARSPTPPASMPAHVRLSFFRLPAVVYTGSGQDRSIDTRGEHPRIRDHSRLRSNLPCFSSSIDPKNKGAAAPCARRSVRAASSFQRFSITPHASRAPASPVG